MHEFAIASEIVQNVLETAQQSRGGRVLSLDLEVGELAVLNDEQVTFWVQELLKGTVAEGARIRVKRVKGVVGCDDCGRKSRVRGDPRDILAPLSCPRCGSFRVRIERGKECYLRRIQLLRGS